MAKSPPTKPTSSKSSKSGARRAKAQAAEHTHASRVAAHLDPSIYRALDSAEHKIAEQVKPVLKQGAQMAQELGEAAGRAGVAVATAGAPVADWFGDGFARLSAAFEKMQALSKDGVHSLAATGTQSAHNAAAFHQALIDMVQANMTGSFAAFQKMLGAGSVNEAIRLHNDYTRETLNRLSEQAKDLQALSAKLAKDSGRPLAEHWSKTAEAFKTH